MKKPNSKKRAQKSRVFDSMASAAAALGVSKEVLQLAKASKEGGKAFRGSRVKEKELLEWISKQPASQSQDIMELGLKDQKLAEEIRKLRIRNDKEEGRLLLASVVGPALRSLSVNQRLVLRRVLEAELPERLAGKTIPQITEEMRKASDQICDAFREGARKWMDKS